jgi:hypothetical protein
MFGAKKHVTFSKDFQNLVDHLSSSDEEDDDSDYKPSSESDVENHSVEGEEEEDVVVVKTVTPEQKETEAKENVIDVEEEGGVEEEDSISFYKEWGQLESWEVIAAEGLEYTKNTWDGPYECSWDNLPDDHKDYLKVLGMDEEEWFGYQLEIADIDLRRMDPYNNEFYTKQEFYDYYGNNDIWERIDPKLVFYRKALQETYRFASHLSPMIQTKFIDCMMKTYQIE